MRVHYTHPITANKSVRVSLLENSITALRGAPERNGPAQQHPITSTNSWTKGHIIVPQHEPLFHPPRSSPVCCNYFDRIPLPIRVHTHTQHILVHRPVYVYVWSASRGRPEWFGLTCIFIVYARDRRDYLYNKRNTLTQTHSSYAPCRINKVDAKTQRNFLRT